jgi:hypothetical protein
VITPTSKTTFTKSLTIIDTQNKFMTSIAALELSGLVFTFEGRFGFYILSMNIASLSTWTAFA